MTTPAPTKADALVNAAAEAAARKVARLQLASDAAYARLAHGWPWRAGASQVEKEIAAQGLGADCITIADGIIAASQTRRLTEEEIRAALVFAGDAAHEES